MPQWLEITLKVAPVIISIICLFGVGAYFSERWKHRAKVVNAKKEEEEKARARAEAEKQARLETTIRNIVKKEIEPIKKDIANLKETTEKQMAADVLNERCNMWAIHNRCKAQGYSDIGDKVTMKELYSNYDKNGGNEFKAFVDRWYDDVLNLPDELPEDK